MGWTASTSHAGEIMPHYVKAPQNDNLYWRRHRLYYELHIGQEPKWSDTVKERKKQVHLAVRSKVFDRNFENLPGVLESLRAGI